MKVLIPIDDLRNEFVFFAIPTTRWIKTQDSISIPMQFKSHAMAVLALAFVVGWLTNDSEAEEGVLETVRLEVRGDDDTLVAMRDRDARPRRRKRNRNAFCDDDDGLFDDLEDSLGRIFFYIIASPFWVPPAMLHDDYYAESYFASYPYQRLGSDRYRGYMMADPVDPEPLQRLSLRVTGQYGTTFDDLSHVGGRIQFDGRFRFGIDATAKQYSENLSNGTEDELTLGDANIVFRFAQSRRVQMRAGLGLNWLSDTEQEDFGFNFTYGGDWFPDDPFVVSTDLDWGRLGDSDLLHLRITGGVLVRNVESFIGFDYLDIGPADEGSLIAGVRLWF